MMSVEAKRGCGFRKVGGLYLVDDEAGRICGMLPLEMSVCPTCHAGIKQSRGWTWINAAKMFADVECKLGTSNCASCAASQFETMDKVGLLWIGKKFYPTVEHFTQEAQAQGISRRLSAIPRDFVVGETWVFLAHPEAMTTIDADGESAKVAGVFRIMRPTRIEQIVNESDLEDEELMTKLAERNITPVAVPDDDPDHH